MKNFLLYLGALLALSFAPAMAYGQDLNPAATAAQPCTSELGCLRTLVKPSTTWRYVAASGGITDTTAVTIKAAAGAGKKNYVRSCQIGNSGAAGTEVWLVSGAAGTVVWRGYVGAAQSSLNVRFDPPIESAANTLLEVDMSSGTTIAVRVNCQGYTD